MYYTLFEKKLLRKRPFHQKVLHFQYDIPLRNLRKAFNICVRMIGQPLFMTEECSDCEKAVPAKQKLSFDESVWIPSDENKSLGLFDESETFYIQLDIGSKNNEKDIEALCGNLYLFAEEDDLAAISGKLQADCGQVILESAADYFILLED